MQNFCIWLTGLPGSGKSTIAHKLQSYLKDRNIKSSILDGDIIREHLNSDLGYTKEDRRKNVLRTGYIAKLIIDAGGIAIVSLVSPFAKDRTDAYKLIDKVLPVVLIGNPGRKKHWQDTEYELNNDIKELNINTEKTHIDDCVKLIILELMKNGIHLKIKSE